MADLWLENCKIAPDTREKAIGIEEGKIIAIKKTVPSPEKSYDLKGLIVLPGLIDVHAHLRDPGFTYKEDFSTGTRAAAAGGFTTILDMPNTNPPTNTVKAFKQKLEIAYKKSIIDFGFHAGVGKLPDIKPLSRLKPASFKIYMDLVTDDLLEDYFKEISEQTNIPISLHAEDMAIVEKCTQKEKQESNQTEAYARARPPEAETIALEKAISLALKFGLDLHICHLSTRKSLEIIQQAKRRGCRLTCEITPHHLFLDSSYLRKYGNLAKTNPPLRKRRDKLFLNDLNLIDMMGTDHAPHALLEKKKSVWEAPPGIPNLETCLTLLLTQINKGKLSFNQVKRVMCENPAKRFRLKGKGFIKEGMDADLVIVDLKREGQIDPQEFHSKAKYSPFKGFKTKGMPIMTMVRGKVVMKEGILRENKGQWIKN